MSSSSEHVRYLGDKGAPSLRSPRAVVAFGGWIDAATAGTGAVRYLINTLGARPVAEIDPEDFYSFTDTRPLTSVAGPGERTVLWPRGEFHAAPLAEDAPGDLLLLVAPEPNLRWRTYAHTVIDVCQRFGTESLLVLGSIFGAVHHRAAVPLTGWATDPQLRETLQRNNVTFTSYEGPTGFATILLEEARQRGLPAAAIFAFTPSYVQGVPNPRTSHALLRSASTIAGLPLPLDELERAGDALQSQVDRLLTSHPELGEQVQRLMAATSEETPTEPGGGEPAPPAAAPGEAKPELPTPQAFVREMEEFLKTLRTEEDTPDDESEDPR